MITKQLQLDKEFFQLLERMLEERFIGKQKHPTADYYIYNYMPKTQYEREWNVATLLCRGLILDGQGNTIARPLPKFFNMEELVEKAKLPKENFEVFEKMDGSMGISYFVDDKPFIATRGSFISLQAEKANELLNTKYKSAIPLLKQDRTYLFEIIYPTNRIVVDYGDREELVLLAVIDKETGQDLPLEDIGFPLVKHYDGLRDLNALKSLEEANREGFVIRYQSGTRMKVKFEEYVRLHRILTQVSSRTIWECLAMEMEMEEILDRVPDEFYDWVRKTEKELRQAYKAIEAKCKDDFKDLGNRKENAFYYQTCAYPAILFKMLDKRDYSGNIWALIRPEYEKPFTSEV